MSKEELRGVTNTQLESRLRTIELWRTTITNALNVAVAAAISFSLRVKALEDAPAGGGVDYSAQIATLASRLTTLENKVCPQEGRIAAIEADHNAPPTP